MDPAHGAGELEGILRSDNQSVVVRSHALWGTLFALELFHFRSNHADDFAAHGQKLSGGEAVAAAYVEHSQARFDIASQSKNAWQKVAVHVRCRLIWKAIILVLDVRSHERAN